MIYAEKFVKKYHKDARIEAIGGEGHRTYAVFIGLNKRLGRHCKNEELAWNSAARELGYTPPTRKKQS